MNKIIHAWSGHTLYVESITFDDLPEKIKPSAKEYSKFWIVRNWDKDGHIFMYLGKGYKYAPKEIVAWYPGGGHWSSFGLTLQSAIDGAQKDGWMYA